MTNATSDLRQRATRYRDHLEAELAQVKQFLAMADHIDKATETMRPTCAADGEEESVAESPLNLFAGKRN